MKMILFTRFNRLHRDKPQDKAWRVKKTINNRNWWEDRLDIMNNTLRQAVENQIFKDFEKWAIFTDQIETDFYKEAMNTVDAFGFEVIVESPAPYETKLDEPYQEVVKRYKDSKEPIVLVNVDSDDLIADWCLKYISELRLSAGMVVYFEDGYLLDYANGDLYTYSTRGTPANFNAMVYYSEALKSVEAWIEYKKKYDMDQEHYNLHKCKNSVAMPSGAFMHVVHNVNTSMSMDNPHFRNKIVVKLGKSDAERIKKAFNVGI